MPNKKQKLRKSSESTINLAAQIGLILMSAATTFGMMELPDHSKAPIVLPTRPVFAFANDNENAVENNTIRRERDEVTPHYVSYSVSQRTPSRSGKR